MSVRPNYYIDGEMDSESVSVQCDYCGEWFVIDGALFERNGASVCGECQDEVDRNRMKR